MSSHIDFMVDDVVSIKNKTDNYKIIGYTENGYEVVLLDGNMNNIKKLDVNKASMKMVKKGIKRRRMESSDSEFASLKGMKI